MPSGEVPGGNISCRDNRREKMYKDLLPIGSVVKLAGGERYVMIIGRIVVAEGSDDIFDYVGCVYPEGVCGGEDMLFFNRDAVDSLYFVGFQDEQELIYRGEILDNLGELRVVDGEIVPVED